MNRTLIMEICTGLAILVVSGLVAGLWGDVKTNRETGLMNKDAISTSDKVGEGEIKRSTAVDNVQEADILDNKLGRARDHDSLILLRIEVGKLQTAISFLHKAKE